MGKHHRSPIHYKLMGFNNNVWVIICYFVIALVIAIWLFYWLRLEIILNDRLNEVDLARLILSAIIVAAIAVIILWCVIQYTASKL